ncbi:MAG: hypothetical protein ACXAD7_16480 [Candidatus Kariarchaeaceae archaeon]|jgi:GNAT superfamily N-acetyltransferase
MILQLNIEDSTQMLEFFVLHVELYKDNLNVKQEDKYQIIESLRYLHGMESKLIQPLVIRYNDEIIGRLILIIHFDINEAWISYFEAKKGFKSEIRSLFETAEAICRQHQITKIIGPKNDNMTVGLQTKGFHLPHTILTPTNPKYYKSYFKAAQFRKISQIYTFYYTRKLNIEKLQKYINRECMKINLDINIRCFDKDKVNEEIQIFHDINKQVFAGRDGYIERTIDEDKRLISQLLPIIDEKLIIIAETNDNDSVGMLVALPDANQLPQKIDRIRIITIGVVPEWQRKGVGLLMAQLIMQNLIVATEYQYGEASFIFSHNIPPLILARKFKGKVGRKFELYQKMID